MLILLHSVNMMCTIVNKSLVSTIHAHFQYQSYTHKNPFSLVSVYLSNSYKTLCATTHSNGGVAFTFRTVCIL